MQRNRNIGIILGDSGYAQNQWLFTPVRNETTEAEERYNRRHRKTRSLIEQTFGRFKMDWRVLHNECRLQPGNFYFLSLFFSENIKNCIGLCYAAQYSN